MILSLFLAAGIKHAHVAHRPHVVHAKKLPAVAQGQHPKITKAKAPVILAATPPKKIEPESDVVTSATAGPPVDPSNAICSLDVASMDPNQIVQILGLQTHANLVMLTKPDTKLTIRLSHLPLSQMIRHICALCDLEFLLIDKTYVIASPDKLKSAYPVEWKSLHPDVPIPAKEESVTQTYNTNFVTGGDLAKSLTELFKNKSVTFAAGPNPLSPAIGNQDGSKATGTTTAIIAKNDSTESTSRVLVVSGNKDEVLAAIEVAKQLDRPRRQVRIAVTIHDISDDALKDLGVTWDFGSSGFKETQGKGVNFGTITRSPLSVSATLTALDQSTRSKLLASPNISVLDGEHAFVLIGDRIAYPVLVGYSQNNAPIFSKEEERVGIYLQVAATISEDGKVTLSLYPQVSTITGYLSVNGASYPQISTREAQTTIRVDSGSTIVMGGLYSDEDIAIVDKVPFLSQIPILGAIFQHRKITKNKSQVIITVTPIVVDEKGK